MPHFLPEPARWLTGGVLLAAALAGPACAQEATIPNVESWAYTGLKSADGLLYFTMRQQRNVYDLFHLDFYGRDLQKLGTTDVKLGRGGRLLAARAVGDYAVLFFYNGKDGQLLKFDAAGKQLADVHVPAASVWGSIAAIEPAGGGDFYVAYPTDAGKSGYAVARFGADMAAKWSKDYAPEKGKYQLRQFTADATHAYAVDEYSKEGWEITSLDGATGAEKARKPLAAAPNKLEPTLARVDKAGRLVLAGPYLDKSPRPVVSAEKPGTPPRGGLGVQVLTPEGQEVSNALVPYASEQYGQIRSHSTIPIFTVRAWPAVKWHELLEKPGGGFALVGETVQNISSSAADYAQAGGTPNSNLPAGGVGVGGMGRDRRYVADYVVMDFDAQGQPGAVRRIPKPYKLYQMNNMGFPPDDWNTRSSYAYRFLARPGGTGAPRLVELNWHQNLQYVNSVGLTDVRDNLFTRTYLDQPVGPAAADRGELTVREFKDDVTDPNRDLYYDDLLPHAPGKALYSHYDPTAQTLYLRVVDIPGMK